MSAAADLEASLDFDEDELPEAARAAPVRRLNEAADDLETLLATWEEGRLLREGARVVIAGGPNVGKSTLLNVLLGTDRAIVTDVPGTTRDTIEEPLVLEGIPLRLIDTAGLRDSDCRVEGEGVRRARAAMEAADLVIHVLDASAPGQAPAGLPPDKTILLLNKIDLGQVVATESVQPFDAVPASLKTGQGVPELKALIVSKLGLHTDAPPHAAISERHRHLVQGALNELNSAREVLHGKDEALLVAAASSLRQALDCLGRIVGKVYDQDLLDAVFQKFCIGK